ncbi:RidA family protein [Amycolatopsis sp. CA-161197]|uniref:RidA family protein n=1 Tax=unclassified Amycolatopsis TaxID=2618356 RepID=UPI003454E0DA
MSEERITRVKAPKIPGISDSVRVAAGDLVFISGAVGFPEGGGAPESFEEGVELVLKELDRALTAAGVTFDDLVRINVYVTDLDADKLRTFREVRDRWVDPGHVPASTFIGVARLFDDRISIEIDAIAAG